nr:sugar transporter ERD6-like 16 [Hydra vulgaris]
MAQCDQLDVDRLLESDNLVSYRNQKERTATIMLSASVASLSSVSFGYVSFFWIVKDWPDGRQWYSSSPILFFIAASIGCVFAGILIDLIGRKSTILVNSFIYLLGYILVIRGFQDKPQFLELATTFSCIFCGFGAGITSLVVPVYITEVSSVRLRGVLGAINHYAIILGIFLFRMTASLWSDKFCNTIVGLVVIVLSFFMVLMPETPRWLIAHDKQDKALKNQLWLLGIKSDAEDECNQVKINLAQQHIASVNDFRSPGLFRPLIIGSILLFSHDLTFIAYIFYFLSSYRLFKTIADVETCVMVQLPVVLLGCFLVHRVSRRKLLLFGSTILFLSCIGFYVFAHHESVENKILLAYVNIFNIIYGITWGPLPWIIVSEIFPPRARGLLGSILKSFIWLLNIPMIHFFNESLVYKLVLFCAIVFFLSILFVYYFVPETKRLTLEEIEHYYIIFRGFRNYLL